MRSAWNAEIWEWSESQWPPLESTTLLSQLNTYLCRNDVMCHTLSAKTPKGVTAGDLLLGLSDDLSQQCHQFIGFRRRQAAEHWRAHAVTTFSQTRVTHSCSIHTTVNSMFSGLLPVSPGQTILKLLFAKMKYRLGENLCQTKMCLLYLTMSAMQTNLSQPDISVFT